MKNILIGILTLLCGALGYMQFGMPNPMQEPCPVCEETPELAAVEPEEVEPELINADEMITLVEIHGISLSTPLEEVDEKLAAADFTCNKNDNVATASDKTSQYTYWRCKHNVLENTAFNLDAREGLLVSLGRSGNAYTSEMDAAQNRIDFLKSQMASREGMRTVQSNDNLTFNLSYTNDEQQNFKTQFILKYPASASAEDAEESGPATGRMNATVTR